MAKIHTLPGVQWNAHALFEDAKQTVDRESPCLAIWIKNDTVCWSGHGTNMEINWMLSRIMKRIHD